MPKSLTPEDDRLFSWEGAKPFTFTVIAWGYYSPFSSETRSLARLGKLVDRAQRWGLKGSRVKDDSTGLEFTWKLA